jgi:hypothetical protein
MDGWGPLRRLFTTCIAISGLSCPRLSMTSSRSTFRVVFTPLSGTSTVTSPKPATHRADRSTVEECLDQLKDTCLHRIREAFNREQSITTIQIPRFNAYKNIYEEHYTTLYQRHAEHDGFLPTFGGAVEECLEKQIDELVLKLKTPLLTPNCQDIVGIIREKNNPAEGLSKAALQIMAEVRSYYDRK